MSWMIFALYINVKIPEAMGIFNKTLNPFLNSFISFYRLLEAIYAFNSRNNL